MGSESVQISSCSSHSRRRTIHCYYGLASPLMTALTSQNRFYGCGQYKLQGRKGCSFFEWYDNKIPDQSEEVINSLLKKVNDLKKKDDSTKKIDDDLKRR